MFDFIKNFLSPLTPSQGESRTLERVDDLMAGDIITFHLLPQPTLSGKNYQVTAITTYDFKQGKFTTFTLKGESNHPIYLTECTNEGEEYLTIRQKLSREMVDEIFGLDNFSTLFEEGSGVSLRPLAKPESLDGWLSEYYHKEIDCRKGYRHLGDYRNQALPEYEDESEGFDYYLLLDRNEEHGIEIEVYDNGETDVYVAFYPPFSVIESMWPGK